MMADGAVEAWGRLKVFIIRFFTASTKTTNQQANLARPGRYCTRGSLIYISISNFFTPRNVFMHEVVCFNFQSAPPRDIDIMNRGSYWFGRPRVCEKTTHSELRNLQAQVYFSIELRDVCGNIFLLFIPSVRERLRYGMLSSAKGLWDVSCVYSLLVNDLADLMRLPRPRWVVSGKEIRMGTYPFVYELGINSDL